MIVLDANILVIDLGYVRDVNFNANQRFLACLQSEGIPRGITSQGLLEVVGKGSFGASPKVIARLPSILTNRYCLTVHPDPATHPGYAGIAFDEIVSQMERKMSLGDAVMARQIERFAPQATSLLTWNAKHFIGKIAIPVMTPAEWLAQRAAGP